ncbi:GH3 auxin-responsive promoter [Aquisphaera giovannonii]|uniref:GH3 auxin-responsive promoter n=1 Tax=Aquisphaera giovannonii TaxID=406548 RepID=A0A5B9VYI2_9BACT|nr:GH3 auxin-responsive promoter family protein [Aquisphaera giovannonii]QEH32991.1 GH3 auxin-responsive promoter [Aquisphaera giovannonii]
MAPTSTGREPSALLAAITGSPIVRGLVNAGFVARSRRRHAAVRSLRPAEVQERVLRRLVRKARDTRFGRDHGFGRIEGVAGYQAAVPLRTYEALWGDYLRDRYPILDDVTWPGRIPYFALTSGTTQGATKYIPVSREMVASNRKAAETMLAFHVASRGRSRLFHGRMFFLGGTTQLEEPAPGVRQGDLSGIAALEVEPASRAYTFPPLELALESDWDRKLSALAERGVRERITLVSGVPSWLLMLFRRVLEISGKATIGEAWPELELVVHGGVKFDPYAEAFRAILGRPDIRLQDAYACSEGFIAFGDPGTGHLRLALDHGLFYEFVPVEELDAPSPTRHWLADVRAGVNYAVVVSTCAGLWSHVIGDTVRFESVDPPLITFTGRTRYTLSAFGEHLINEEVEGAVAVAAAACGASAGDWHVGPVFRGELGFHQYVVEFVGDPPDPDEFRRRLDADLSRRNADYLAHRAEGVGLPLPALIVAREGSFASWMRARGKLGGQNKVPRMDSGGKLTADLVEYLQGQGLIEREVAAG